jgi:hypothetical protein
VHSAGGTRASPRSLHAGFAALVSLLSACTGELTGPGAPQPTLADAGDPVDNPADASPVDPPIDAAPRPDASPATLLFDAEIDPIFVAERPRGACASCHEGSDPSDGPDFLGSDPADHRASLLDQPRIVGDRPDASLLFTRGDHAGDALCSGAGAPYAGCDRDEASAVAEWITAEAAER